MDSLTVEEEQGVPFLNEKISKLNLRRKPPRWILWTIILLVTIATSGLAARWYLQHRVEEIVPKRLLNSRRVVTFEQDKAFIGPSSDQAWDDLMPEGRGYLRVVNPAKHGLKPGMPVDDVSDRYPMSVFHQIHCLANIRAAYYSILEGQEGHSHGHGHASHHIEPIHLDHCFDYLRQALMCASDLTLEHAWITPEGIPFTVDGWGVKHQCRDWSAIYQFAFENKVEGFNETGIL